LPFASIRASLPVGLLIRFPILISAALPLYGSLSTVAIVRAWFFLTALSLLLGVEIDIEMERQIQR
jgi:uncharacterized BrkB/YihY/UPF0761 family membrane protein